MPGRRGRVTLKIVLRAGDGRSTYEVPSSLLPPLAPGRMAAGERRRPPPGRRLHRRHGPRHPPRGHGALRRLRRLQRQPLERRVVRPGGGERVRRRGARPARRRRDERLRERARPLQPGRGAGRRLHSPTSSRSRRRRGPSGPSPSTSGRGSRRSSPASSTRSGRSACRSGRAAPRRTPGRSPSSSRPPSADRSLAWPARRRLRQGPGRARGRGASGSSTRRSRPRPGRSSRPSSTGSSRPRRRARTSPSSTRRLTNPVTVQYEVWDGATGAQGAHVGLRSCCPRSAGPRSTASFSARPSRMATSASGAPRQEASSRPTVSSTTVRSRARGRGTGATSREFPTSRRTDLFPGDPSPLGSPGPPHRGTEGDRRMVFPGDPSPRLPSIAREPPLPAPLRRDRRDARVRAATGPRVPAFAVCEARDEAGPGEGGSVPGRIGRSEHADDPSACDFGEMHRSRVASDDDGRRTCQRREIGDVRRRRQARRPVRGAYDLLGQRALLRSPAHDRRPAPPRRHRRGERAETIGAPLLVRPAGARNQEGERPTLRQSRDGVDRRRRLDSKRKEPRCVRDPDGAEESQLPVDDVRDVCRCRAAPSRTTTPPFPEGGPTGIRSPVWPPSTGPAPPTS